MQPHAHDALPVVEHTPARVELRGPPAATQIHPRLIALRTAIRRSASAPHETPIPRVVLAHRTDPAHRLPGLRLKGHGMNLPAEDAARLREAHRLRLRVTPSPTHLRPPADRSRHRLRRDRHAR